MSWEGKSNFAGGWRKDVEILPLKILKSSECLDPRQKIYNCIVAIITSIQASCGLMSKMVTTVREAVIYVLAEFVR